MAIPVGIIASAGKHGLKLFVARLRYRDKDFSPPVTLWAADLKAAVDRLNYNGVVAVDIRELPLFPDMLAFFDNRTEDTAVMEHPHIPWKPEW